MRQENVERRDITARAETDHLNSGTASIRAGDMEALVAELSCPLMLRWIVIIQDRVCKVSGNFPGNTSFIRCKWGLGSQSLPLAALPVSGGRGEAVAVLVDCWYVLLASGQDEVASSIQLFACDDGWLYDRPHSTHLSQTTCDWSDRKRMCR